MSCLLPRLIVQYTAVIASGDILTTRPTRRESSSGRKLWAIGRDSSISEVILSGGDPLAAGDNYLKWLLTQIDTLRQITTIRIHTRLPVVIPQRITSSLCQTLASLNSKLVIVIHCNHGQEIDLGSSPCKSSEQRAQR